MIKKIIWFAILNNKSKYLHFINKFHGPKLYMINAC
jgi:hypothetical protein